MNSFRKNIVRVMPFNNIKSAYKGIVGTPWLCSHLNNEFNSHMRFTFIIFQATSKMNYLVNLCPSMNPNLKKVKMTKRWPF